MSEKDKKQEPKKLTPEDKVEVNAQQLNSILSSHSMLLVENKMLKQQLKLALYVGLFIASVTMLQILLELIQIYHGN